MEAILKREVISSKALCRVLGVSVFIIMTALGAFVRIPLPFTPVPLTLQTFFVLLSGAALGGGLGASSQMGYILLGLAGMPIFSGAGSGLFYALGPTGGYLIGFVLASYLVGNYIKRAGTSFSGVFLAVFLADLALLVCGVIWLKFVLGQSLGRLLFVGFLPFIPGDLLKAYAVTKIYFKLKPRLKSVF